MGVVRRSPCKINLLLNILGRRPDGYHELETLFHPVPVFDRLEFDRGGQTVHLTCTEAALPVDSQNLVHRAASAFRAASGIGEGVRIHLEKRLPLAAGLGGGSANAAATLLALNALFGEPLSAGVLHGLAARLGSDVPFFLQAKPALATGRGEAVQPLEPLPALQNAWALLIYPGFGVSTAWAYQNLARFPAALAGEPGRAARLAARLQTAALATAGSEFSNALEAPVLDKYPVLALYQEFLRAEGAPVALLSGSGSTTFALFPDEPLAQRARDRFLAHFGARCWTALAPLGAEGLGYSAFSSSEAV